LNEGWQVVTYVILCCLQVKTPDVRNQRLCRNSSHQAVFCVLTSTSPVSPVDETVLKRKVRDGDAWKYFCMWLDNWDKRQR